jgi:hypothetical protein
MLEARHPVDREEEGGDLSDEDREIGEDLSEDDGGGTVESEGLVLGEDGSTGERGRDFGHSEQGVEEQDEEDAAMERKKANTDVSWRCGKARGREETHHPPRVKRPLVF